MGPSFPYPNTLAVSFNFLYSGSESSEGSLWFGAKGPAFLLRVVLVVICPEVEGSGSVNTRFSLEFQKPESEHTVSSNQIPSVGVGFKV